MENMNTFQIAESMKDHVWAGLLLPVLILGMQLIFAGKVSAQNYPRVNGNFLRTENSPRSLALGEATVATVGYAGAGHLNPATIGDQNVVQAGTNISALPGEPLRLQSPSFSSSNFADEWNSTASASYRVGQTAAELRWQTYQLVFGPFFNEEMVRYKNRINRQAFSGTLGYQLGKKLRLGIGVNYIQMSNNQDFATGNDRTLVEVENYTADLGLQYSTIYNWRLVSLRTNYGWSLTDFGPTFPMVQPDQNSNEQREYSLPMTMRLGTTITASLNEYWHERPLASLSFNLAGSKLLARSDDEGNPYAPFRALFSSWGSYEMTNGNVLSLQDQIGTHRGVEISIADVLYARLGNISHSREQASLNVSSYGFGLDLYYLAIDVARVSTVNHTSSDFASAYTTWQLTARIPLSREDDRNFWPELIDKFFN